MIGNFSEILFSDKPAAFTLPEGEGEVHVFHYDQIGIDEIRALTVEAHRKPAVADSGKQIVVTAKKISLEAQQAALKILEEPPASVRITIVLPVGTQLLSTVLSRVQTHVVDQTSDTSCFDDWRSTSYADRLGVIEEKLKTKDIEWMQSFKHGLQQHLKQSHGYSSIVLKQLDFVVNEFLTRGASNKMVLEHLALSLPLTAKERK